MTVKISVVTISYNAENEIEKTIISVIHQNYNNIEYIIVDGASSDNTLKIANRYKGKITTIISERDSGIYNAMNKSLRYCSGDWVIFMNAGDCFANDDVLLSIFSQNYSDNIGVLYGYTLTRNGRMKLKPFVCKRFNSLQMGFCHQSSLVRRDLLELYKFDEKYMLAADYNLMYRLWKDGYLFHNTQTDIALFDTSGVSSVKQFDLLDEISSFTGLKNSPIYYLFKIKLCLKKLINIRYPQ